MLQFKSIREILEFALAKEQSSYQFYTDLSYAVTNPACQGAFVALAREEARHIELIETELYKKGFTLKAPTDLTSEGKTPEKLEMDEEARQMDFLDVINLAIEKERASFRLYAELMAMTEEGEAREVFASLAEEEMRHMLQLERELEHYRTSRHPAED